MTIMALYPGLLHVLMVSALWSALVDCQILQIVPSSRVVHDDATVTVECEIQYADNSPYPYTAQDIQWYFNSQVIPEEMFSAVSDTLSELLLPNVTVADAGNYTCILNDSAMATAEIHVGTEPVIANFTCQAWNMNEMWCTWDPVDTNIPTDYVFKYKISHENRFTDCPDDTFKGPNSCYFDKYNVLGGDHIMQLVATNLLGTAEESLTLDPDTESVPDPPERVQFTPSSSRTATVRWNAPSKWEHPNIYKLRSKLQYYSEWDPGNWSQEIDAGTQVFWDLANLEPYTCYTVRAAVHPEQSESYGPYWSGWSVPGVGCTSEEAPSAGVELYISDQTTRGLLRNVTIGWQLPPRRQRNGIIIGYDMEVYNEDDPSKSLKINIQDGNATEYMIQDLQVYSSYEISVWAYNSAEKSPQVYIRVADGTSVPGHPEITSIHAVSDDSIFVAWQPPDDPNGEIVNYVLSYMSVAGNSKWKTITLEGSVHSYTVGDLQAYVQYVFRVQARNELGYGYFSDRKIIYTLEGAPSDPPSNLTLEAVPTQPTVLAANWKPPCLESRNGIIRVYKLTVCPVQLSEATNDSLIVCQGDDSMTVNYTLPDPESLASRTDPLDYEITGLKANTGYAVSVSALTTAGEGPATEFVLQKTSIGAPSEAPKDVTISPSSVTDSEMTVSWTYPQTPDGVVVASYRVEAVPRNNTEYCDSVRAETGGLDMQVVGLCGYETYVVVVRACSDAFVADPCGPGSEPVYGTTKIGSPSAPLDVKIKASSESAVIVNWEQPHRPNGPLESLQYLVLCTAGGYNNSVVSEETEAKVGIDCEASEGGGDVRSQCRVQAFNGAVRDRPGPVTPADVEPLMCYGADVWIPIVSTFAGIILIFLMVYGTFRLYKCLEKYGALSTVAEPYKAWMVPGESANGLVVLFGDEYESYDAFKNQTNESDTDKVSFHSSDHGVEVNNAMNAPSVATDAGREGRAGRNGDVAIEMGTLNSERSGQAEGRVQGSLSASTDPEDYTKLAEVGDTAALPPTSGAVTESDVGEYSFMADSGASQFGAVGGFPADDDGGALGPDVTFLPAISDDWDSNLNLFGDDFQRLVFGDPGDGNADVPSLGSEVVTATPPGDENSSSSYCQVTQQNEENQPSHAEDVLGGLIQTDPGAEDNSNSAINSGSSVDDYTILADHQAGTNAGMQDLQNPAQGETTMAAGSGDVISDYIAVGVAAQPGQNTEGDDRVAPVRDAGVLEPVRSENDTADYVDDINRLQENSGPSSSSQASSDYVNPATSYDSFNSTSVAMIQDGGKAAGDGYLTIEPPPSGKAGRNSATQNAALTGETSGYFPLESVSHSGTVSELQMQPGVDTEQSDSPGSEVDGGSSRLLPSDDYVVQPGCGTSQSETHADSSTTPDLVNLQNSNDTVPSGAADLDELLCFNDASDSADDENDVEDEDDDYESTESDPLVSTAVKDGYV